MIQPADEESGPAKKDACAAAKSALSDLALGDPAHFAALTVFPITSERRSAVRYLLLEEGLRGGTVKVREVDEGGAVPKLVVENRAELDVLIVDGEELVGAKQNRVANLTLLVEAGRATTIPVSCVERGRWGYNTRNFDVTERVQDSGGRAQRLYSVQAAMQRDEGNRASDQSAVWERLEEKAARMEVDSPTEAMSDIYEHHGAKVKDYVQELTAKPGQTGALFVVGGQKFGVDLFDKHETLAAFFPKLVRSYAIDAMEEEPAGDSAKLGDARRFLEVLSNGSFAAHAAVALGEDIVVQAEDAIAGALVHQQAVLHLTGFSRTARASVD